MLDLLHRSGGGALVVVLAQTTSAELSNVTRLRRRFGSLVVVQVDSSAGAGRAPAPLGSAATLLRVTPTTPFGDAWDRAITASRPIRLPPAADSPIGPVRDIPVRDTPVGGGS
jgi:hypothetical protein